MASPEREEIAQRYGFESFAELLDLSTALPMLPADTAQAYVARRPNGRWFIWEDVPDTQGGSHQPDSTAG